jgi:acetamidase/formamidase
VIKTQCPGTPPNPGVAADELLAVIRTSQPNASIVRQHLHWGMAGEVDHAPVKPAFGYRSLGDAHAAQGDGLALETSLTGRLQVVVLKKGKRLKWPRVETPTHYILMGLNPDLDEAMRIAVRETIDFLVDEKGLTRDEALQIG